MAPSWWLLNILSSFAGAATADPQQLSPPLLAVRPPPSPLLSSALTTPRGPQRPHSPTPRVIQYAASRPKQPTGGLTLTSPKGQSSPTTPPKTAGQGALSPPAFGLLTAPTWSTTGSRAHSGGLLSIGQSAMGPRSQTSPMLRAQVMEYFQQCTINLGQMSGGCKAKTPWWWPAAL